ncbi:MAG TPA: TraB/GumN family protein [Allosphingosinicella sp.]|nr:TraB/GumN family protein [Allosphingosinicella sp.]
MKKMFLAALLALLPAFACAQAPSPANNQAAPANVAAAPARPPLPGADRDADPALWVVRDADTTIYLFGTIHLLDGRTWFNDEVKTAFDASRELVLEARIPENPAALQSMILQYAVDRQGRTISSRLTPAQNAALNRELGELGVPNGAFDRFEPWFVGMTMAAMSAQKIGMSGDNGPEMVLTRAAQARSMPIGELEGMEHQLRIFDAMPEALQIAQLVQGVEEIDEIGEKLPEMLTAWSTGDVQRLAAITNEGNEEDGEEGRALHRILFTDRNAAWAGWIQQRLARPGTVFIAVGAGHLAGDDSVQAALRARGIQSERVPHVVAR